MIQKEPTSARLRTLNFLAAATLALTAGNGLEAAPSAIFSTAGFSGSAQLVNFNIIGNEVPITTQYAGQGVTFGGGLFGMTNPGDTGLFPSNGGGVIASDWRYSLAPENNPVLPWTATFATPQVRVGFLVEVNGSDTTEIRTYSGATLTGTVTLVSAGTTPVFFGAQDLFGFDSISVTVTGFDNHFIGIDDFRYDPIPEPGAAMLLGSGLLALGFRPHRRRRTA